MYRDELSRAAVVDANAKLVAINNAHIKALRVENAQQAMALLLQSERICEDLEFALEKPDHFTQDIVVRRWCGIPLEYEFRCFIYNQTMNASTWIASLFSLDRSELTIDSSLSRQSRSTTTGATSRTWSPPRTRSSSACWHSSTRSRTRSSPLPRVARWHGPLGNADVPVMLSRYRRRTTCWTSRGTRSTIACS